MLLVGALLALQLTVPPPAPDSAPIFGLGVAPPVVHTDPATWSKDGWRDLRWGMGPTDALEHIGAHRHASWRGQSDGTHLRGRLLLGLLDPALGGNALTRLEFRDAGLRKVSVDFLAEGAAAAWLAAEGRRLEAAAGKPSCRSFLDGDTCEWRLPGARVLRIRQGAIAALRYGDPAEPLSALEEDRPGPDALRVRRTAPSTWRRVGVQGLRLGMGMEDVAEVLYGACAGLACGLNCRIQQHPPDTVDCEAPRPRTRLEQGRLQVEFVRFARDGGLSAFQLHLLGSSREDVAAELDAVGKELAKLPPAAAGLPGLTVGPELVSGFLDHAIVEASLSERSGSWELAVGLTSMGDPERAAGDGADESQPLNNPSGERTNRAH